MDFKQLQGNPQFILNFRGQLYDWKTKTWACDHLKANNWSAKNFKKHVTSRSLFFFNFLTCYISVPSFFYNLLGSFTKESP